MALTHRWTGRSETDLIARVRLHCYGAAQTELPRFVESVTDDPRVADGDFLVLERDGRAVGTTASMDLTMHTRGASLPCQGVAYVGAVRTARRRAGGQKDSEEGVATAAMRLTLDRAREKGQVVSALMPFRASYYERFGYGIVEHQCRWTLPTAVLPGGDAGDFQPYEDHMLPGLVALRNRSAARGNCDFDRPEGEWRNIVRRAESGFLFVDEGRAWAWVNTEKESGVVVGRVMNWGVEGPAEFAKLLRFLGTMKDQYARFYIVTPTDWPVNLLLKETQVPHRPVAHVTAESAVFTRMMLRVLDHVQFLEAIRWPREAKGRAVVSIREAEGHESRVQVSVEAGRGSAGSTQQAATFTTTDRTYAAIATGLISATDAVRYGLAEGDPALLDTLHGGPKPFSFEYF